MRVTKLYRMLSHAIEETINEADEDKVHFNYFKDYFLTDGGVKNWEQISRKLLNSMVKLLAVQKWMWYEIQIDDAESKSGTILIIFYSLL